MKTKTSHTPGPWIAGRCASGHEGVFADGGKILVVRFGEGQDEEWDEPKNAKANARLAAAAPDLLTVAREIVQYLRAYPELNQRCAELAEDAIAKAEGK